MAAPNGWNEEVKMYKCVWTVCLMCVNMNEYMNEAEAEARQRQRGDSKLQYLFKCEQLSYYLSLLLV